MPNNMSARRDKQEKEKKKNNDKTDPKPLHKQVMAKEDASLSFSSAAPARDKMSSAQGKDNEQLSLLLCSVVLFSGTQGK